jgi:hypothetical protein
METQPTNTAERTQLVAPPPVGPMLATPPSETLETVPEGSPFRSRTRLQALFRELRREAYDSRWVYERGWWRNLLYLMGRQWIYYDPKRGQWVDKRIAKWIPRPVTNLVLETVQAIMSVFQAVQLEIKARPQGYDPVNIQTAEIVDRLHAAIAEDHQIKSAMRDHDFWLVVTGNAFLRPWWDKRASRGVFTVPYEECAACGARHLPAAIVEAGGVCPSCGAPTLQTAVDPATGEPAVEVFATGRGATDVLSPFEVAVPPGYARFEQVPYAIVQRWRTRYWAEANLPREMVRKIPFSRFPHERSLQLIRALAVQGDIGVTPVSLEGTGGHGQQDGYVEYELLLRPTTEFPDGALIRYAGEEGEVVLEWPDEAVPGPLPYVTSDGQRLFNLVHTTYQPIGGRLWGISPLDPIIQKVDQINQIDSLSQLIIQRVANPVWLEPKGAEVQKFSGEPGLVVRYNPLATGGAEPKKIEGSNVPGSLIQIRRQLIEDIERLAGTYDVIKGAKPVGVEAFSALQLLVERSQSRFAIPLANRGESYRQWFAMALELERAYGPDERTWAVLGPNEQWTRMQFRRAHLQGAIDILLEDGSQLPKTSLGMRASIEQLRQMNAVDFSNPDVLYSVLRTFGATSLIPALDAHVKAALQEQDAFERWAVTTQPSVTMGVDPATGQPVPQFGVTPPPQYPSGAPLFGRKPWHDDAVHLAEHRKWLNSDRMRQLLAERPWVEPMATQLLVEHLMAIAATGAPMGASAPPGEPGGAGRALTQSNQESGNPEDVPRGTGQRADNRGPE